jgi:hypothetical protein
VSRGTDLSSPLRMDTCLFSQPPSVDPSTGRAWEDVRDLQGRLVLPGMMDAHIHVGYMGECAEYLQLAGTLLGRISPPGRVSYLTLWFLSACDTITALKAAVKSYATVHPNKAWIVGVGWDQSSWGRYPSRHDLDEVSLVLRGRNSCSGVDGVVSGGLGGAGAAGGALSCLLAHHRGQHRCYEACWRQHGGEDTFSIHVKVICHAHRSGAAQGPSREGVDVDAEGLSTGIFRESAVTEITSHISEPDVAIRVDYFRKALRRCVQGGLTMVQTNDTNAWKIYQDLQAQGTPLSEHGRSGHLDAIMKTCHGRVSQGSSLCVSFSPSITMRWRSASKRVSGLATLSDELPPSMARPNLLASIRRGGPACGGSGGAALVRARQAVLRRLPGR